MRLVLKMGFFRACNVTNCNSTIRKKPSYSCPEANYPDEILLTSQSSSMELLLCLEFRMLTKLQRMGQKSRPNTNVVIMAGQTW